MLDRFKRKKIRAYSEEDLEKIIEIYKRAFAEPPWNERWTDEEVKQDLEYAMSQRNPLVLVATRRDAFLGFAWGYELPIEKFPFLQGIVNEKSMYIDDIAVDPNFRAQRVGRKLTLNFLYSSIDAEFDQVVLRTDETNKASMALFTSVGFSNLGVYDPQFPTRIYLKRELRAETDPYYIMPHLLP